MTITFFTSETQCFSLCFALSIADRPMDGLGQRPNTTGKNVTMMLGQEARGGSETFQNNQKVLFEYSYEYGGDDTLWTQLRTAVENENACIIKAVTILQIFWPLVCWKMAVPTVQRPACMFQISHLTRQCAGNYPQWSQSYLLWRQSCFGSSHFSESSIVDFVVFKLFFCFKAKTYGFSDLLFFFLSLSLSLSFSFPEMGSDFRRKSIFLKKN